MFDAQYVKSRLQKPLPGESAQIMMAHAYRRKLWPTPKDAFHAGVLVHFYPIESEWHTVLIQRTARNSQDRHAGQISFPGGKKDPDDENIIVCALREGKEELGLEIGPQSCLGQLTPLYIPVSNFLVHPIVSWTAERPIFKPQPEEVQGVLEVPIRHFLDSNNIKHTDMLLQQNTTVKDVPYFDVQGNIVWGATAMIISELIALLSESTSPATSIHPLNL